MFEFITNLFKKPKPHKVRKIYNCARVYEGFYVGGDTNEFEQGVSSGYRLSSGKIRVKQIKSIMVRGTNSEGTIYTLKAFNIFPITETAVIEISSVNGIHPLKLIKVNKYCYSRMFRQRL